MPGDAGAQRFAQHLGNGVAILGRNQAPTLTRRGLPGDPDDRHSRYIEAAVDGIVIGCLYLPNGNPAPGPRFDYKLRWWSGAGVGLSHPPPRLAGVSQVQLFSGIRQTGVADGTIDKVGSDAAPLLRVGWVRVDATTRLERGRRRGYRDKPNRSDV